MENERRGLSVNQALIMIEGLKGEMLASGSVDSEVDEIRDICFLLQQGSIAPEDAVSRVSALLESRQSYH